MPSSRDRARSGTGPPVSGRNAFVGKERQATGHGPADFTAESQPVTGHDGSVRSRLTGEPSRPQGPVKGHTARRV